MVINRLRLTIGIVISDGEKDGHFYGRWLYMGMGQN